MPSHRARFVAVLVVVAGAVTVLAGCSGQTVAAAKVITTTEACQSIRLQVRPAALALKAHIPDAKTNPDLYQESVTGYTEALLKASKSTKNTTVSKKTAAVSDALAAVNADLYKARASRSAADVAQMHADEPAEKSADTDFQNTCGFRL